MLRIYIAGEFLLFTFTTLSPSILVVVVSVLISAAPLLTIRPVDAILGRLSQKGCIRSNGDYLCALLCGGFCWLNLYGCSNNYVFQVLSTQENWSIYKGGILFETTWHKVIFSTVDQWIK